MSTLPRCIRYIGGESGISPLKGLTTSKQNTLVFLTTYPPRECGIATFSFDLIKAIKLISPNTPIKVAALNLTGTESKKYPLEVSWQIDQEDSSDFAKVAAAINADKNISTVIIQHEYGIFGDNWGANILTFLEVLKKPFIVSLHTVWANPPEDMFRITNIMLEKATKIVVMSKQSRDIIINTYPIVDHNKIQFIPHGIHPVLFKSAESNKPKIGMKNRTVLTTFGLLSRNKGIEYVLKALPPVVAKHPEIIYLILGGTHPVIRRKEGESYRIELLKLTEKLGLKKNVRFYDQYFPLEDILKYLQATDIYLFTALDPMQSVSGTFSYALGTGRAVISTTFNQAKEMITRDTGRLVPMKEPAEYSAAILELLQDPALLDKMHDNAYLSTRSMLWSNVGEEYLNLISAIKEETIRLPSLNLNHFRSMVDDFGLVQFAKLSKPDYESGYTLDDNARALLACLWMGDAIPEMRIELSKYISIFLSFLDNCLLEDGTFVNYIGKDKHTPTAQNYREDMRDSVGRAFWVLASIKTCKWYNGADRHRIDILLSKALPLVRLLSFPRSISTSILGFSLLNEPTKYDNDILKFADQLIEIYRLHALDGWHWFEPELTYANGLMPAALFAAAKKTSNKKYELVALDSLNFLIATCFYGDIYVPIGQKKWYKRDEERSIFDAQPEDATATLIALEQAFEATHDQKYVRLARKCFSWYRGNNLTGFRMYDTTTGGCFDGLKQKGVNHNQGAESLISYLMSRCIIDRINKKDTAYGS